MIDTLNKKAQLSEAINIQVKTVFLDEQSDPYQSRYVYAYTISITNNGEDPVQLISRHWVIANEAQQIKEIKGPGVVGEQPVIQPGKSYTYSSGVVMETAVGTMAGSYQMQTINGDRFEASIPTFTLVQPHKLH